MPIDIRLPSVIIPDKCKKFRIKYESCSNLLYKLALTQSINHLFKSGDMAHTHTHTDYTINTNTNNKR